MNAWRVTTPGADKTWRAGGRKFALDMIGLGIWWGEGAKFHRLVSVTNTDPDMILIAFRWLREVYGVPLRKFRMRVSVHYHLDPIEAVKFWSMHTGVPRSQFYKTTIYPKKTTKRTNRLPFGVCTLSVHDVRLFAVLRSRLAKVRSLATNAESGRIGRELAQTLRTGKNS